MRNWKDRWIFTEISLFPFHFFLDLSREAQLFVGWVRGSVNYAGVGFHASTQPTFFFLDLIGFLARS
ncbi:MAG: hypothetical protein DWQ58_22825 [Microcystis aeruginosa TA09]|nr:MAG: hypothetical protein DWQ58_22825 [Microcystis aeruginosa TA09]